MPGILSVYHLLALRVAGQLAGHDGNLAEPVETTVPDGVIDTRMFDIPAGGKVTLWEYVAGLDEDFAVLGVIAEGGGLLHVQTLGDKPTSASDSTPLGTHECWNAITVCRVAPLLLSADVVLVNPSAANHAGDPGPIYHADEIVGKLYKVEAWNPESEPARVHVVRVN
ncbi:MAG: hypothetical protein KIS87_08145 [Phycisphaeraceae bacterium]|nr:hypothetical protein [Phycisphaeraceae bacterium]